jgi:hypothetical protein
MRREIQWVPQLAFKGLLCASWRTFYPVRKTLAEKKGVIMKRAMALVVVMAVLLFSQLAFAEWEFHPGELTEIIWEGEVQDQGLADQQLAAAGLRIVPLQAYTHPTPNYDDAAVAWWNLDQPFYETVLVAVYGSGDYSTKVTVTDVKTGISRSYRLGQDSIAEGYQYLTYGPTEISGPTSGLPRVFKVTYSYKVGTVTKSVFYKFTLY